MSGFNEISNHFSLFRRCVNVSVGSDYWCYVCMRKAEKKLFMSVRLSQRFEIQSMCTRKSCSRTLLIINKIGIGR